jgi:hypothetical protein
MSDSGPATTVTSVAQATSVESLRPLIGGLKEECSALAKIISAEEVGIIERFHALNPPHPNLVGSAHPLLIMYPQHAIRGYIAGVYNSISATERAGSFTTEAIGEVVTRGDRDRVLLPSQNGKFGADSLKPITVEAMLKECGDLWQEYIDKQADGSPHKAEITALIPQYRASYERILGYIDSIGKQLAASQSATPLRS